MNDLNYNNNGLLKKIKKDEHILESIRIAVNTNM